MDRTPCQKIADALIVLSVLALLAETLLLPWISAFACFRSGIPSRLTFEGLMSTFAYDFDDGLGNLIWIALAECWLYPDSAVLSLFLWVVAVCGAVILVQGICILATVADGAPFSPQNARALRRAALACFAIAAGALGRTVFTLFREGAAALVSYTALFVPLFVMAGLFCLGFSGLFCQAAEIKEENDLTV